MESPDTPMEPVESILNIHLGVQACDFSNVEWTEPPNAFEKKWLETYGAILETKAPKEPEVPEEPPR